MIKIQNINENSTQEIKEFREKQVQANIKLHKIFFVLIILVDLGFFIFILAYKFKISSLKSRINKSSYFININRDLINKNIEEMEYKAVNILAINIASHYRFSFIFKTKNQVDKIKNYLVEFYRSKNMNLEKDKFDMNFKYMSLSDGDFFKDLKKSIDYSYHNFIFIETYNNKIFGIYFEDIIMFDKMNIYSENSNECFIISFQKEGIFRCIGTKDKLEIVNNDNMIIIGNGDIIIKNNFLRREGSSGVINFPFKSFDISEIKSNIFTETKGEFSIKALEIFSFNFNL